MFVFCKFSFLFRFFSIKFLLFFPFEVDWFQGTLLFLFCFIHSDDLPGLQGLHGGEGRIDGRASSRSRSRSRSRSVVIVLLFFDFLLHFRGGGSGRAGGRS